MTHPGPDAGDRVALACPSCADAGTTVHEVLKPGGQVTVRCTACGHVHKERYDPPPETELDVVVSQGDESLATTVDAPAEDAVEVGDEFVVDTPEAIMQVRITSIEVADDTRVEEAAIEDVATLWTRAVDNVRVNVTVHPNDGRRDDSRSITVSVPGDHEFVVGETAEFGDEEFEITGLQVRDDAPEYRFEKLDHDGDTVFAKDTKRVYGRDVTSAAWSAW
ncbi:HVO_0476 family zinc finger protein [Haloplanus halophilus]|uniref:HVO_0476 family zinc finger protein n=1 Tax=Haloplanus halophilus TaxID=2949993 RepID=UPI002040B652|nr:HVO_0476 family zinc finger protein [Haloplanus sp. GDY1]